MYIISVCIFIHLIRDIAMTSSIKIAWLFPELVGTKADAICKVYGGLLRFIINYAFNLAHCCAYFHINDDAKK